MKKWLGNTFISLFSSENLQLKEEKKKKILLHLLSISTREPLIIEHCLDISLSSDSWWGSWLLEFLKSRIELMMWFEGNECAHRWNLPLSFCKWRWIEIRPAITLIPNIGNVQNASVIHIAALLCIFLSSLSRYISSALL